MDITRFTQTMKDNQSERLVAKKNIGQLHNLLKQHMAPLSLDEFTNLLRSVKSLEKTFFKSKPLTNKKDKRCLVQDTDEEDNCPTYPTFLEFNNEKGLWIDKMTGIGYKDNSYSSQVVKYE
jgi:hypothetical protein